MQPKQERILLVLAAICTYSGNGSAFQLPPSRRSTLAGVRGSSTRLASSILLQNENPNHSEDSYDNSEILVGSSPKAIRLRRAMQDIWNNPENTSPIILHGPPGSGKSHLAEELVYRLPSWQTEKVHRLSMTDIVSHVDMMLGTESHPGLLDELSYQTNTTLVLLGFRSQTAEDAEKFKRREEMFEALTQMVKEGSFYSTYEKKEKTFEPRIVVACSRESVDFLYDGGTDVNIAKVPAFESRTADMTAIATSKIKHFEHKYGLNGVLLSREATHRLLDHRWELGESELDSELCNALKLLSSEKQRDPRTPTVLESKHMLVNSSRDKMRHRLLYEYPALRRIIQSPWVFDHTLRYIVTPLFAFIIAVLFLGPQTRDHSTALTVFWAGWWPAVMLAFPFLGRIWCAICPFMAVGTLAQEAVTNMGIALKKWPNWVKDTGALFAFALFFAILMWEELWDLPQNGSLSAWLLLLITSGAVFNSVQYESRAWCRYLCPIGAMCRIFGTLSITQCSSPSGEVCFVILL